MVACFDSMDAAWSIAVAKVKNTKKTGTAESQAQSEDASGGADAALEHALLEAAAPDEELAALALGCLMSSTAKRSSLDN